MKFNNSILLALFFHVINSFQGNAQNIPLDPNQNANNLWRINGNTADSTHFIGTKNLMDLKFRTNNVERLRITEGGFVGIGTNSPKSQLEVNGSTTLRNGLNVQNLVLSTDLLGHELVLIDGTGKIGKSAISTLGIELYTPNNACKSDMNGDIPHPTWANGLNKIFVECPLVYVGIGNSTPRSTLDVSGTTYSSKLSLGNSNPNSMGPKFFHLKTNNGTAPNQKIFVIENAGNKELFSINNNGSSNFNSVSIHSQLDDYVSSTLFELQNNAQKLIQIDNQGLLKARRIIVNQEVWSDFVFDQNYQLMSLKEVEKFIQNNKHLPDVPSEEEVKIKGIDISDMNAVLLQKIEEMTLYIIQLNKQLEDLQKEIELLKSQNK